MCEWSTRWNTADFLLMRLEKRHWNSVAFVLRLAKLCWMFLCVPGGAAEIANYICKGYLICSYWCVFSMSYFDGWALENTRSCRLFCFRKESKPSSHLGLSVIVTTALLGPGSHLKIGHAIGTVERLAQENTRAEINKTKWQTYGIVCWKEYTNWHTVW
jgi:hypothetical protein